MNILGIETSCDETAVCLIGATGSFGADFRFSVLGNALFSQAQLHAQYGGVFPNVAKREHAKHLVPLLEHALQEAALLKRTSQPQPLEGVALESLTQLLSREQELLSSLVPFLETHEKPPIDAIAVTVGPGLEPALWVGINFAKALSSIWSIPVVAVDHMEGHILMPMMTGGALAHFDFPLLSLLISGGHTELVLSNAFHHYQLVGQTRDDAAGEAFDKVARLMDLPYPGGPEISRLARAARAEHLHADISFTRPMLHEKNYDFSFSGLKTAVRKAVEAHAPLTDEMKCIIAREFEDAVADVLVEKTMRAAEEFGAQTLIVGGGVSANSHIRQRLQARVERDHAARLLIPEPELATDNALMIALAGYFRAERGQYASEDSLVAQGNKRLA